MSDAKHPSRSPSAGDPKGPVQKERGPLEFLDRTTLAIPLIEQFEAEDQPPSFPIIIDLNLDFTGGLDGARRQARKLARRVLKAVEAPRGEAVGVDRGKSAFAPQYLFARLTREQIIELVRLDHGAVQAGSIYKIWPDFQLQAKLTDSVSTVKADAAQVAFDADGGGMVWAVIDSGIDGRHPHFKAHGNLELPAPLRHCDFVERPSRSSVEMKRGRPKDAYGHGTHVAGIIAGEIPATAKRRIRSVARVRDPGGSVDFQVDTLNAIRGVAPKCKLVSLRVLDERGQGPVSNLIAALGYVMNVNENGRWNRIHGVNLSVGYEFDAKWFACGQSPLCVEVDRLVRSGVVVVVSAGNTGYGPVMSSERASRAGLDLTINDPGNAELAITVGSTHRHSPHLYGVSYFSSKGPTGDGRLKPDLVAPGEKIISCAAGRKKEEVLRKLEALNKPEKNCDYLEHSGTSMAAPHVSGSIAAFLSIRREFVGRPEKLKEIFLSTATDLRREKHFQGHGLVDLMRAIQSV